MQHIEILRFMLIFLLIPIAFASSGPLNVVASVTVTCPFYVTINASPAYMRYSTFQIKYSLQSITDCYIQNMSGNFVILNSSNGVVYSQQLMANYTNLTKRTYSILLNATSFKNGTYTAKIEFANQYTQASNASKFEMLNPANIIIARFYTPNTRPSQNSQLVVYVNITNNGALTSNPMRLAFSLTGPTLYTTNFTLPKLMPGAYDNISFTVPNGTAQHGTYTAFAKIYYSTTAPYQNLTASNSTPTASFSYYVTPGPVVKPVPIPITPLPTLSIESAPMSVSTVAGQPVLSQISFSDTSSAPETVNLTVAPEFQNIVSISASSLVVKPGEVVTDSVVFRPFANATPGAYVVPINISTTIANITTTRTQYIMLSVVKKSNGTSLSTQMLLLNNATQASGTIAITAPSNSSLSNFTVATRLPLHSVSSISQITAYGLPSNITEQDGYYVITWHVAYLPKGQTTYAYYSLNKPNPQFLVYSQNLLQMPSKVIAAQVLRILNIEMPSLYTNSTGKITISALYTGSQVQNIYFMLTAPPAITIRPAELIVNASTNQLLIEAFNATSSSSTGTFMLSLYVSTPGFNNTYSLPLVVLPKPYTVTTVPPTPPTKPVQLIAIGAYAEIVIILAFSVAIIIAIAIEAKKHAKHKYRPEYVEHLARLKQQIERSDKNE